VPNSKKIARLSITNMDYRMKGALTTIRHVADYVGESTPLVATGYLAATAAMLLFRPHEVFLEDMINDPAWVDQMCKVAADWTLDWIRSQYDAGANSVTFVADSLGTYLISSQMGERFNLPYLSELVQTINKEFNQGVWLHMHGQMNTPLGHAYSEKIIKEARVEGLHLDDCHTPEWIKENVVDEFNIPACITIDCHKIAQGPVHSIQPDVKHALAKINDGLGIMMAPSCQVLPYTPNELGGRHP
jgi:uroporphyrinogen-III decarboxylase